MNEYTSLAEKLFHFHFVHQKLTWNGLVLCWTTTWRGSDQ